MPEALEPLGWRVAWPLAGLVLMLLCCWCRALQQSRRLRHQLRTLRRYQSHIRQLVGQWEAEARLQGDQQSQRGLLVASFEQQLAQAQDALQKLGQHALLRSTEQVSRLHPVALAEVPAPPETLGEPSLLEPVLRRLGRYLLRGN